MVVNPLRRQPDGRVRLHGGTWRLRADKAVMLELAGVVALVVGVALLSAPAAWIVGGLALIIIAQGVSA
jgi:hypothetical protein